MAAIIQAAAAPAVEAREGARDRKAEEVVVGVVVVAGEAVVAMVVRAAAVANDHPAAEEAADRAAKARAVVVADHRGQVPLRTSNPSPRPRHPLRRLYPVWRSRRGSGRCTAFSRS